MPTQSPAIQCTTAEFAFLASLLGAPAPAALAEAASPWPGGRSEEGVSEIQARLAGRGLIRIEPDGSVRVSEAVAALVGTCSAAQATFVATYTAADGELVAHQFHVMGTAAVELVVYDDGDEAVCELTDLCDAHEVLPRLAEIFRLGSQEKGTCPGGSLRERALRQVRSLVRDSGRDAAESYLVCMGLYPETAAALAEALDRPVGNGALLVLTHEGGRMQADGLGLLEGENGLWLLRTVERDGCKWVDVAPCSALGARQSIGLLFRRKVAGWLTRYQAT